MNEEKPIDLNKEKSFNLTLILNKTDEFIDILEKLDILYPIFSNSIKKNKRTKIQI